VAGPPIVIDTLNAAIGRTRRDDPVAPTTGGPAGNARLTAWTGLLLLALSVAELITLVNVHRLISWHIIIGTLLIPPALLKTASTGWRIARYYGHNDDYRHAGPPPILLRILGPGVVASTLGLLASGLVLVLIGQDNSRAELFTTLGQRVDWLTLHQGLFIVWAALTGLHVLARLIPSLQLTVLSKSATTKVDGARLRAATLCGVVLIAALAASLVLSAAGSWRRNDERRDGPQQRPRSATAVRDASTTWTPHATFALDARFVSPDGTELVGPEAILHAKAASFARSRTTHHVITDDTSTWTQRRHGCGPTSPAVHWRPNMGNALGYC
jgi:hypothetical protein